MGVYDAEIKKRNTFNNGEVDERAMYYDKLTAKNAQKQGGTPIIPKNKNANIEGFPMILGVSDTNYGGNTNVSSLGVQRTGGVVNTKNTKSPNKSSSSVRDNDIEKTREAARKALEKQIKSEQKGLGNSYEANLAVLQNLMASVDPTYAEYQRQYQTQMDQNKQKDLNQMAAQFAAYGTGDSEQRNQAQERMYGEYQKSYSDYLANLERQKREQLSGYENQRLGMEGEYRKGLEDIKARNYAGQASMEQNFAKMIQDAQQQQFDNQIKLASLNKGGAGSEGFTAVQQQKVMGDYNDDLQAALGKAAYMPQGGREQVYNEMVSKYGNILDPESIYSDIFSTYGQDGWEGNYKQMYKNPVQEDPYTALRSLFSQSR